MSSAPILTSCIVRTGLCWHEACTMRNVEKLTLPPRRNKPAHHVDPLHLYVEIAALTLLIRAATWIFHPRRSVGFCYVIGEAK